MAEGRPCAICGKPIDYSLDWWVDPKDGKRKRHPLSAEVDEIIPISRGGSPIEYENLQMAHRICNQRRGNKPMESIKGKQEEKPGGLVTSRAW